MPPIRGRQLRKPLAARVDRERLSLVPLRRAVSQSLVFGSLLRLLLHRLLLQVLLEIQLQRQRVIREVQHPPHHFLEDAGSERALVQFQVVGTESVVHFRIRQTWDMRSDLFRELLPEVLPLLKGSFAVQLLYVPVVLPLEILEVLGMLFDHGPQHRYFVSKLLL